MSVTLTSLRDAPLNTEISSTIFGATVSGSLKITAYEAEVRVLESMPDFQTNVLGGFGDTTDYTHYIYRNEGSPFERTYEIRGDDPFAISRGINPYDRKYGFVFPISASQLQTDSFYKGGIYHDAPGAFQFGLKVKDAVVMKDGEWIPVVSASIMQNGNWNHSPVIGGYRIRVEKRRRYLLQATASSGSAGAAGNLFAGKFGLGSPGSPGYYIPKGSKLLNYFSSGQYEDRCDGQWFTGLEDARVVANEDYYKPGNGAYGLYLAKFSGAVFVGVGSSNYIWQSLYNPIVNNLPSENRTVTGNIMRVVISTLNSPYVINRASNQGLYSGARSGDVVYLPYYVDGEGANGRTPPVMPYDIVAWNDRRSSAPGTNPNHVINLMYCVFEDPVSELVRYEYPGDLARPGVAIDEDLTDIDIDVLPDPTGL